ncbi:MAG TPA: YfhO family protein, partial [Pyrinomonadaceae bacterium]
WANSVVGVPLLVFLMGAAALAYWGDKPRATARTRLLLLVLFLDLASFGWFYEWSYGSPDKSNLSPPAVAHDLTSALNSTRQRFLPVDGYVGLPDNLPPDLSRMWGVPSASGYNVLRLERVSRLLLLYEGGNVEPSWSEPDNQSVSLMAIRYVFAPRGEFMNKGGVSWLGRDLNLWTGEGCGHDSTPSLTFDIPTPFKATRVGLVSMLSCSTGVPDGTEVASLSVTDANGRVQTQGIVAGRDTSEWAYDCSNIPTLQHKRATIFKSYPAKMFDASCEGHHYVTMLNLDTPTNIKSVSLQWKGGTGGLVIEKVSVIDDATHASYPVNPEYLDGSRYRLVQETDKVRLYENLRAMPRVWLAHELALVNPEEALQTIKTSKLPDGNDFDPLRTALVEESLNLPSQERDPNASAEVLALSDNAMEVRTSSASPSILVSSDAYYPGWKVSVDGQSARLFRADYAIRGVLLPAGQHLVRFQFRPRSFYYGAAISAISLLALLGIFSRALILTVRRKRVLDH